MANVKCVEERKVWVHVTYSSASCDCHGGGDGLVVQGELARIIMQATRLSIFSISEIDRVQGGRQMLTVHWLERAVGG
jgi:hypothetical protein